MNTPTLRDRIKSTLLAVTGTDPGDMADTDWPELAKVTDALLDVVASEVHRLAENLPHPPAAQISPDAPGRTWLLAAEWECGFNASRDAARDYLLDASGELRGSERVAS